MKYSHIRIAFILGIGFILGLITAWTSPALKTTAQTSNTKVHNVVLPDPKDGTYRVTRVLDGDTVEIQTGERVRYHGIDAPEAGARWGEAATNYNKQLVLDKQVRLELDKPKLDTYGRVLAYVWVGDTLVNEQLVQEGLARVRTMSHETKLKYIDRLRAAEDFARARHNGLWLDTWEQALGPSSGQ